MGRKCRWGCRCGELLWEVKLWCLDWQAADDAAVEANNDSSNIVATARPWWLVEVSLDRGSEDHGLLV